MLVANRSNSAGENREAQQLPFIEHLVPKQVVVIASLVGVVPRRYRDAWVGRSKSFQCVGSLAIEGFVSFCRP